MRFFAYAPALALASIAAAAPVAQVSQPAGDNAPVKLQLGATENAPAAPHALNDQNPAGVDNSNQDQFFLIDELWDIGKDIFKGITGSSNKAASNKPAAGPKPAAPKAATPKAAVPKPAAPKSGRKQ
ncbi:hypothetical protein GGI12_003576 [Dipsacomyces acuminosporus]|nr:hypothetical protein GGI12_003576 [Dipsacomyces acuminosporus]